MSRERNGDPFVNGLQWCSFPVPNQVTADGIALDKPWHWALEPTLTGFTDVITGRP